MATADANDLVCLMNCLLVLENGQLEKEDLWIDSHSGKIVDAQFNFYTNRRRPIRSIDLGGNIISAGLLDIQINGAYGFDFSIDDGDDVKYENGLKMVAEKIVETGVTSLVPTIITQERTQYPRLTNLLRPHAYQHGASLLGWHAEGPFLQTLKKGAHDSNFLLAAPNSIETFSEVYGPKSMSPIPSPRTSSIPFVRIITLAPELDGVGQAIQDLVTKKGITVSIGHSIANSETAMRAVRDGARLITHLFNAMPQLHHRDPAIIGLLGAGGSYASQTVLKPLANEPIKFNGTHARKVLRQMDEAVSEMPTPPDTPIEPSPAYVDAASVVAPSIAEGFQRPYYGLIVDGIHSHPHSVRLAYTAHPDGCILVTDAMSMLDPHLPDGIHEWRDGRKLVKHGEQLCVAGTDTLAGSVVTLDKCVRNFAQFTGASLGTSILCATLHPAKCLEIEDRKGTLRSGADADLTVWDSHGNVLATWVGGKQVWERSPDAIY
ncbi:hypothetical protein FRB95_013210 [Tulasnella sp. JGI-2019a]|nr:hypothetical protein FRB95_013210 [Tulasnella sp. JGI-2019a]